MIIKFNGLRAIGYLLFGSGISFFATIDQTCSFAAIFSSCWMSAGALILAIEEKPNVC